MEFIIPPIILVYILFITIRDYKKLNQKELSDASIELEQKAKEWKEYMEEIKNKTEKLKKQLKQ